ncbi:MAG: PilZ domain-containing protein [Candidatus Lernaella stagnicola]|nr:PilZ domain-containing protein [Candidatus Lernaella stagnicola]
MFKRTRKTSANMRVDRRVPSMLQVQYSAGGDLRDAFSTNISQGGLFLQATESLHPGLRLHLRIRTPSGLVRVIGRVAWYNPGRNGHAVLPGFGIQFQQMTDDSHVILDRFLQDFAG